ncbi:unnamed protein product [Allacma fusca]|uniref:Uncharacterized protein n=1 Tax=Allacma fusca TaxID=39272 RepID=A0A8J2KI76_9HEXA|nr:unnamed protein product [Allacma fusca]
MLTKHEVRWNFAVLNLLSRWQFLPIMVNVENGIITKKEGRDRRYWKILFIVLNCHLTFIILRLVQVCTYLEDRFLIGDFCLHILLALAGIVSVYMSLVLFVKWPYLSVKVFNELYCSVDSIKVPFCWNIYTVQEYFIIFMFILPFGNAFLFHLFNLQNPNRVFFLASILDPKHQNLVLRFICLTIETPSVVTGASSFFYALFIMFSTFQKLLWSAEIEIVSLGMPRKLTKKRIQRAFMVCRRLQLHTQLFNQCFADINYALKPSRSSLGSVLFTERLSTCRNNSKS